MNEVQIDEWHARDGQMPQGLARLVAEATEVDGHRPLDEHALAELKAGPKELPHAAFTATVNGELAGYAHVSYRDTPNGWRFEFVTRPSFRGQGIATRLIEHVRQHVAADGGGRLHAWQPDHPNVARDRIVQRFAMREIRRLDQMHADLPIPQIAPPRGISIRAFEPADTSNWIAVHNQIFATHPDASGWRPSDLSWRMAEHWFDPQGFRLALDEQGIAGYNWVKLHNHPGASHDPSDPQTSLVGEIYMLGVAERARSSGLSRAIATDGLAWAFSKGATRAMLYVEADNHPALALYRSLGFSRTHTDRCFEITVSTSVAPSQ